MTFQDLSLWDLNLIKSNAIQIFSTTKCVNRCEALVESTLSCIYAKGFKVEPYPNDLRKDLIQKTSSLQGSIPANEIIEFIFKFISDFKLGIIKDENRSATWSTLRDAVFNKKPEYKKPWVI